MTDELEDDFFEVDPEKLEKWLTFARDFRQASRRLADAKDSLRRADACREVVKAELAQKMRLDPERYGLKSSPTIPAVNDAVLLHKTYQEAQRKAFVAEHTVDVLKADVAALSSLKTSMEEVTSLWFGSYFAEPRARRGVANEAMREAELRNLRRQGQRKAKEDE